MDIKKQKSELPKHARSFLSRMHCINKIEKDLRILSAHKIAFRFRQIKKNIYRVSKLYRDNQNPPSLNCDLILEPYLNDVFAIVRECSRRILKMRPFDVQVFAGLALHRGCIVEMKTGEGKTLASVFPAILNSMLDSHVHIVTTNDYLASRDADQMGKLYNFLGISYGALASGMTARNRQKVYSSDIIYGRNSEFGFDYLKDHVCFSRQAHVQTEHNFAIIDEVDSILIDEARTPLVLTGTNTEHTTNSKKYIFSHQLSQLLQKDEHFKINLAERSVLLLDAGISKLENTLRIPNIFNHGHVEFIHCLKQSLTANYLYNKNREYIIKSNEVVIVDDHTGRLGVGRKWSDGLHQSIEAKENVPITGLSETDAQTTYQNYFKTYKKVSGMTGTAETESEEFLHTYGLDVVSVPTNRKLIRIDEDDKLYSTKKMKNLAIISEVKSCYLKFQPVLLGATSIEESEHLENLLKDAGIPCNLLNAKVDHLESMIVAQAGLLGQITIATNIAGRGTDIILGGENNVFNTRKTSKIAMNSILKNEHFLFLKRRYDENITKFDSQGSLNISEIVFSTILKYKVLFHKKLNINRQIFRLQQKVFTCRVSFYTKYINFYHNIVNRSSEKFKYHRDLIMKLGGLRVIGTERNQIRRIDYQFMGRSGRQGDPGSSCFYISLDDEIFEIYGGKGSKTFQKMLGSTENSFISHPMVSKSILRLQTQRKNFYFEQRKHLLEYDDIIDTQRKTIYFARNKVLFQESLKSIFENLVDEVVKTYYNRHRKFINESTQHYRLFVYQIELFFNININNSNVLSLKNLNNMIKNHYYSNIVNKNNFKTIERHIFLIILDKHWKKHLKTIECLRSMINFRTYAEKNPYDEYRKEIYKIFIKMVYNIKFEIVEAVFNFSKYSDIQYRNYNYSEKSY